MKNLLKYFSIVFTVVLIFTAISCRKNNSETADNDPNINDRLIDSVSVSKGPGQPTNNVPIDIDEDGFPDFFLAINENIQGVATTAIVGSLQLANVLADDSGYVAPSNSGALIDSVSVPKGPKPGFWSDYGVASIVGPGISLGEANGQDFYLAFYTTKFDGVHYVWLKINIPIDGKSIRLRELGYHRRPATAIRAGVK